ncbi:MAG: L-aspartate oxidase [Planctomycetota bacterium]|nr:L-aspartate oxidase [Planctomycetota bacterium]
MEKRFEFRFPTTLGGFDSSRIPVLTTDVLVIGGGVAGGGAALTAAAAGASVLLLSKTPIEESNTAHAQGGVAATLSPGDAADIHLDDTLRVGAGLSDIEKARSFVAEGVQVIHWLEELGARFDRTEDGDYQFSHEGGHSLPRVVHAGGAATGSEISRVLCSQLEADNRITWRRDAFVRDLLVNDGRCVGVVAIADGRELAISAGTVIIATGGAGQVFRETTNPIGSTGDGIALCFRAGARLMGMEFVQFHPTTLYLAGAARALISEVIRGAGGVLRDRHGQRFMEAAHPMADLAPRDIVSRAILEKMVETGDTHVYLDLSGISGDVHEQFPTISRICRAFDINIARDAIPVRPGAHYFVGGVEAGLDGRTSIPGLWVIGETAATGFHGANRMASNSLLEGAVMGRRAGAHAADEATGSPQNLPSIVPAPRPADNTPRIHLDDILYSLKSLMGRLVGVTRTAAGLNEALQRIGLWNHFLMRSGPRDRTSCELVNMLTVSALVGTAAQQREESRGTHFRTDHAERNDELWCRNISLSIGADQSIQTEVGDILTPTDKVTA